MISSLERIQPQAPAPPQTPVKPAPVSTPAPVSPNRVVVVAGQRYEVKVVNGKRLMEPIGSPVPPVRSARKKLHPAGLVINPQGVPEDSVPEATPVVVPEALPVEPVVTAPVVVPEALPVEPVVTAPAATAVTTAVTVSAEVPAVPIATPIAALAPPVAPQVRTLAAEHPLLPVREGRGGEA